MKNGAGFKELYEKAKAAGMAAGEAAKPVMMVVRGEDILINGEPISPGKVWYEPEGACGFAWVKVRPGNSSFAKWLKAEGIVRGKAYSGGVDIWIGEFNQSMARKAACAGAMARVLSEAGIKAYADSRMD
jgi:hypothetical protein